MKFRVGILMILSICAIAGAQEQRYLVYNVSSRVTGIGKAFADEMFVDLGETRDFWRGYLLVDTQGNVTTGQINAALVWRAVQDGQRVLQVIDLSGGLLSQLIAVSPNRYNLTYSLASAKDRNNYPDAESLNVVYLEGILSRQTAINDEDPELISRALRGEFFLLDASEESYRIGRLVARLDARETREVNDANGIPSFNSFEELVNDYKDLFIIDGWKSIPE